MGRSDRNGSDVSDQIRSDQGCFMQYTESAATYIFPCIVGIWRRLRVLCREPTGFRNGSGSFGRELWLWNKVGWVERDSVQFKTEVLCHVVQ